MRRFRLPSPSMVVACVALIVAMGGTGYAALKIPRNSVGNKQLRTNAVTSAKVRNGTLRVTDFSRAQVAGLVGPIGPAGPPGPAGAAGAAGPAGSAVAFAHVARLGGIVGGQSKNVGNVSHPSNGVYCFTGLPSVSNVVATVDVEDGAPGANGLPVAYAGIGPGNFSNTVQLCPGAQATVYVVDDNGDPQNRSTYVNFN